MNQDKNAFLLSYDFQEQIQLLSDDEAGQVFKAIFGYCLGEPCPQLSPLAQIVFISIRQSVERFDKNYAKTIDKNRENGQKGGRPAKSENKVEEKKPARSVFPETLHKENLGCEQKPTEILGFQEEPTKILGFEKEPSENGGFPKKPYEIVTEYQGESHGVSPNLILNEKEGEPEPPNGGEIQCGAAGAALGALPPGAPPLRGDAQDTAKTSAKVEVPKQRQVPKQKLFCPPTVEQVAAFCQQEKLSVDASKFVDYYSARNWLIGKNNFPMRDWKKIVLSWTKKEYADFFANPSPPT